MILPLCYTVCYDELTKLRSGNRELKSEVPSSFEILENEAARFVMPVVSLLLALVRCFGGWLVAAAIPCLRHVCPAKQRLFSIFLALSAWYNCIRMLWVIVAALLITLPLQSPGFAMLNSELAFVLPFATLFLVYPHIWVYCKHHLNQELYVCAWMVCLVQHGVLIGLLYNWCKHTEMAIVTANTCAVDLTAGCVSFEGPNLAAHLSLSCVCAALPVAVSNAALSQLWPAYAWVQISRAAAFLAGLPGFVVSQLQLVCTGMCAACVQAACAASQVVLRLLFSVLHVCRACAVSLWLAGCIILRAPAQLLLAVLAPILGAVPPVQSLLQRLRLVPEAIAKLLTSTVRVLAGAAACIRDKTVSQLRGHSNAAGVAIDGEVQEGMHATVHATSTCKKQQQRQMDSCVSDCVVCLDAPRSVALFPCNHVVLCGACFGSLQRQAECAGGRPCCPVCRTEVQQHAVGLILA